MNGNHTWSFNPCFIGLASATGKRVKKTAASVEFQSLFYWISLCDPAENNTCDPPISCFNPCFIGLASATLCSGLGCATQALFQSLFYWISLCDRTDFSFFTPFSLISPVLFSHIFSLMFFIHPYINTGLCIFA